MASGSFHRKIGEKIGRVSVIKMVKSLGRTAEILRKQELCGLFPRSKIKSKVILPQCCRVKLIQLGFSMQKEHFANSDAKRAAPGPQYF